MKVKSLADHINDYPVNGPALAIGEDRNKKKGVEYEIADEDEANRLIDAGLVEKASAKK